MRLLAFDTTLQACSVALWIDGAVASAEVRLAQQGHAELLVPMLQAGCAAAGIAITAVDALAVTVGPGTFTGVRIGLAAARGLRLALHLPVVPVPTLQAVAATALRGADADSLPVLAVHDARRGEVYAQCFSAALQAMDEPQVIALKALAGAWSGRTVRLCGTAAPALAACLAGHGRLLGHPGDPGFGLPDARDFAGLAAQRLALGGPTAFQEPPLPVYLRLPDAKLPAPRQP